ncbi:uncharacterized protein B0H18DRAFT_1118246 [Fomitopsis serialis]|uniref:uncharacterized protein n=1 Tax=Fomitopsis serialis TaxID=139415 RepID=UPI0020079090|nr:uncharacterized protein B0H18DRAFT_1122325 [Neoantrodia serialis]XP_047894363.1 uncharacterized protein B0H18DRAFT_1118246 [Neoantrodia serialis]KAH9919678.1 hypothetical protein B0H18DRAFT_1122325 [Neoantrodia serialis]KAH9927720.1 hypothetical protein B0H18DRAFT_1118246 [Neoantrodia serialis]
MDAPLCRACIVDPKRKIDQHAWLVNTVRAAWERPGKPESYKAMAGRIAKEFDAFHAASIYGLKKDGKVVRFETDAERDGRCAGRVGKIFNWIENNRAYFENLKKGTPKLLELPTESEPVAAPRAKSIVDLYKRDRPEIGQMARQAAEKEGLTSGDHWLGIVNKAYTAALLELATTDPEKHQEYVEESKRSKEQASMDRALALQPTAGPSSGGAPPGNKDNKADSLKRVLFTAKRSVDTWANEIDADFFLYVGVIEEGQCVKYLIGNNALSPDSLVAQMKTNSVLDELDDLVLERKRQRDAPGPQAVAAEETHDEGVAPEVAGEAVATHGQDAELPAPAEAPSRSGTSSGVPEEPPLFNALESTPGSVSVASAKDSAFIDAPPGSAISAPRRFDRSVVADGTTEAAIPPAVSDVRAGPVASGSEAIEASSARGGDSDCIALPAVSGGLDASAANISGTPEGSAATGGDPDDVSLAAVSNGSDVPPANVYQAPEVPAEDNNSGPRSSEDEHAPPTARKKSKTAQKKASAKPREASKKASKRKARDGDDPPDSEAPPATSLRSKRTRTVANYATLNSKGK